MDVVSKNIGCVIVTYNRLSMLRKALQAYEALVVKPMYILVVDNHSQDGTREYLEAWQHEKVDYQKIVVTLGENLGGGRWLPRWFRTSFAVARRVDMGGR